MSFEQRRRDYPKNKEQIAARGKEWQRNNPDKVAVINKRWATKNRHKTVLRVERRRARKRNLPDTFTNQNWIDCLNWFNGCCAYCGNPQGLLPGMNITADHLISLNSPDCPGTVPTNIVPACQSCNASKSDSDPLEWLVQKFGKAKAKRIYNRIQNYLIGQ